MTVPSLCIIALLFVVVMVPIASAETDPTILHKLAKEAQLHVEMQIEESDPPQVWDLLNNGTEHVNLILNSTTVEESEEHFLAAMKSFQEAVELMEDDTLESTNTPDYIAILNRNIRHFDQLLYLADAYNMQYNQTALSNLFDTAKTMIQHDDEGVVQVLNQIEYNIRLLSEEIVAVATEKEQELALQYAKKYLVHLDRFLEVADDSDIPDDIIQQIRALRTELSEATTSHVIVSIIQEIISIKEGLELNQGDQLQLWSLHLEDAVRQAWVDGTIDDVEYTSALVTLEKCRFFLDIEELDEAESLLVNLDNWLVEIEQARLQ